MKQPAAAYIFLIVLSGCVTSDRMVTTMPHAVSGGSGSGCWVHVWEDENFQDDNDRIAGPGKWNNMRNLPGANKGDWGDEIDSVEVGPGAYVTFWEDENFDDNSLRLEPGEKRTNLRGTVDMGDTIDSMEITCR